MLKLIILLSASAAIYGNEVSKTSQGCLNKYYFYSFDDPMNPVPVPADISTPTTTIPTEPTTPADHAHLDETGSETKLEPPTTGEEDHPLYIDNGKKTMVIVHGHGGDAFSTLNPMVKTELFNGKHKHNVIVVDWSVFTKQNYATAVSAVPGVAICLGQFLTRLADQGRINTTITHLVGFNLGAHVIGYAARNMDSKPTRLTGLDPSKNQWGSGSQRLSKTDAEHVEVIHTDGHGVLANGIGTAIGHIDFFVNSGGNQPGCITHQCCHNRAYEVFAATLSRETRLMGRYCKSNLQLSLNICGGPTVPVGGTDFVKVAVEGIYRVNTKSFFPF